MHNLKYQYLNLKFKNTLEFTFEITAPTKERLEEEISQASIYSPKFIYFETCDIRKVYFCPEHLHEVYFESRPCPAEADKSIEAGSLEIYTTTSSEPFFARQEDLDTDALFLDISYDKKKFINLETISRGFMLINVNSILLAMTEQDLFE